MIEITDFLQIQAFANVVLIRDGVVSKYRIKELISGETPTLERIEEVLNQMVKSLYLVEILTGLYVREIQPVVKQEVVCKIVLLPFETFYSNN